MTQHARSQERLGVHVTCRQNCNAVTSRSSRKRRHRAQLHSNTNSGKCSLSAALGHETANFLGICSTSWFERFFCEYKKRSQHQHLLNTPSAHTSLSTQHQHICPSQHNINIYVHFNIHLSQPPSQSATPLLGPRTPKPETRIHPNTTSAHTSLSTHHQHIRPSQHTISTYVPHNTPSAHTSLSTQHQHIRPSQHNISTYVHLQDRSSQGPRRPAYLSFPGPRSGNVTKNGSPHFQVPTL